MADSIVFLFTVSTFMSVMCLAFVFLISWHYESMFLELTTRINHQEQNMIELKRSGTTHPTSNNNDFEGVESVKGVSFTRWGYSECPFGTELVYNGIMMTHVMSTPQCFPLSPNHMSELDRIQRQEAMQKTDEGRYSVPCAVCYSNRYSTVLMQPGMHTCARGWGTLYEGMLITNEASLVCLDKASKLLQESHTMTIQDYHYTKASCNVLPCPPYDDKSNLTCTVCIK